ncbi:hypothetical protein CGK50_23535, partial [Vibrio parahaemolyticus]|uniref:hypothetical protein n=1 Tax=Vibrio parahaemolyticus TaxID=670 RepID=UPI00116E1FC4
VYFDYAYTQSAYYRIEFFTVNKKPNPIAKGSAFLGFCFGGFHLKPVEVNRPAKSIGSLLTV